MSSKYSPGDVLAAMLRRLSWLGHRFEIAAIAHPNSRNWMLRHKALVDVAKDRDGSDNISVQLIRIRTVERVGMYRGRPYRLP